ncbi:MazG nucleotide pyrophosphohydrolase domain-containing protein [Mesobacillus jeotgali]|uniref:MazG nucleotide pyrophosphohydrolase domain-containing protein n=1 Tax=Mesobacillus jeotgali TaxID=129985 RepID=UPI000C85CA54|nr:MazG nucleotide pyrophosphohydrolase domain-containing protein [Mesobacillus jeotgali]
MSLTLQEIINRQKDFDKKHEGNNPFYEPITNMNIEVLEHLIVCIVGEIGEFSNIVKKVKRGDFDLDMRRADLEEELTDVFIYLIKIAGQLNIDLEQQYLKKLRKNEIKFERYRSNDKF